MPKRKSVSSDNIKRKIRKLERKLRRRNRRSGSRMDTWDTESGASRASSESPPPRHKGSEIWDHVDWTDDDVIQHISPLEINNDVTVPAPSQPPETIPSIVVVPSKDNPPPQSVEPAPSTSAAPDTENLDVELLDILGVDPSTDKKYGKEVHKDLSVRLQHWVTNGLSKELRTEFKDKYLTPENCKLIDPPALNPEIKAAVSEINVKRDKAIENKQKQLTLAITSLSEAITLRLSSKERDTKLLKLLMDSARILADCQHADTITRRKFLLSSVKNEIKDHIQNTKIDNFLFGENLHEVLKSAKAINKSGVEMKIPTPKVSNKKPIATSSNSRNLNSKHPGPPRRQTGPPRMKEPATSSTRTRHTNSSRQSQRPPQRDRQTYHRR